MALILSDRYALNTSKRLRGKGMPYWLKFLESRGLVASRPIMSVYMVGPGIQDQDRLHLLCMFALYLKDQNRNPKDHFQALAGEFSSMHHPIWLFTDPMVMLARSTTWRWQGRDLSLAAEQLQKCPVTYEMLTEMHSRVWPYSKLSNPSIAQHDELMAFFAGLSMYNWGLRVSETSKVLSDKVFEEASPEWADRIDNHAAQAADFLFGFRPLPTPNIPAESMGLDWFSAFECQQSNCCRGRPVSIGLSIRTSKTNQYGKREVRFTVVRGSEGEDWLIDGLFHLALAAGYHSPKDMFFSRVAERRGRNPRKRLLSKMVADLIKACAERMDLPPDKFSTKSFKIGGISSLKALGDSQELLQSKMDHASASASAHYQRPLLGQRQGPLAGGSHGYSLESVRTDLQLKRVASPPASRPKKLPCKGSGSKVPR